MTITRYRIIFKDGSRGPWTTDKAYIEAEVKHYWGAKIDTWIVTID